MTFDEFMEKNKDNLKNLLKIAPACISYEMDDKGNIKNKIKGRNIDIQFLGAFMVRDIVKDCCIPFDEYLALIKEFSALIDRDEKERATFEKVFKDLFS